MITSPKADDATIDLVEQLHQQVTRLQGEAKVLRDLLNQAVDILETIDPDDADTGDQLETLIDQIEAVL